MGVKVVGLTKTVNKFRLRRKRTEQRTQDAFTREVEDLHDLAEMMAPRKSGALETAIKIDEDVESSPVRLRMSVYVDGSVREIGSANPNRTVGRYANIIHDNLTPNGELQLGALSAEKDSSQSPQVGGGFMDRAMRESRPTFVSKVLQAVRSAIRI